MKAYHVAVTPAAKKSLQKMDPGVRTMLLKWIRRNLENCENPRAHGKALAGNLSGLWRYRVGDYRLIAQIEDERIVILLLSIGHRREIYR